MRRVSSPTPSPEATTTRARFARGLRLGSPVLLGYIPIGMAFGALARTVGLTAMQATVCSATVFGGAGQFVAISMLEGGATAIAVIIATGIVNLRHVLFGATLARRVSDVRPAMLGFLGFTLTDETFAVNATDLREGDATAWSMAGVGAIAWGGWIAGTLIGALAAGFIGDPGRWGADFAMPAMFVALLVAQLHRRRDLIVAGVAAAAALGLAAALPGAWYVILAPVAAAAAATAVTRP